MNTEESPLRPCLRAPIPEIFEAAFYLDEAVFAHQKAQSNLSAELIRRADISAIRDWTESLWGKNSPYVQKRIIPNAPTEQKVETRMPSSMDKRALHHRDGYHCRFCGIPLIPVEIRNRIKELYPEALPWGSTNQGQHAAFQAMWLQYDHVLPHARGGDTDLENIVITCAPCNFGRMNSTLEEVGLIDPRKRGSVRSSWDGLVRPCLFPNQALPSLFLTSQKSD